MIWVAVVVGWLACGAAAGALSFGYFQYRWGHVRTPREDARHAIFDVLLGPMSLAGIVLFLGTTEDGFRSASRYWRNGRKTQKQELREISDSIADISNWLTSFSVTTGQAATSFKTLSQALEEAPEPPVEEARTPELVLAWRWWSLDIESLLLVGNVARWESGAMEATHVGEFGGPWRPMVEPHDKAPHPGCLCGVNALKVSSVYEYAQNLFDPYPGLSFQWRTMKDPTHVVGRVALTGVVDEYEKGYRAEKAEIIELVVLSDAPIFKVPGVLDALEERYGVRPTIQSRESWLAEMEVIHGYGKEDQADHQRAGADPAGTASGTGQGTSQDFLTARLNRWASIYMVPDDDKDDGLSGVKNS